MTRKYSIALACVMLAACNEAPETTAAEPAQAAPASIFERFHDTDWKDLDRTYIERQEGARDADEGLKQYEIASMHGTRGDICVAAMRLPEAYAKAADKANWQKWEERARKECQPDSRHWVEQPRYTFPVHDDSTIAQDPKLKSEAAIFAEYLQATTLDNRHWRSGDADFFAGKYNSELNGGTFEQRCADAASASFHYLEALDEANYVKWKTIQRADCASAGDSELARTVMSGYYE